MIFGLLGIGLIGFGIWLIARPQKMIAGVVSIALGLVLLFGAWNGSRSSSSCHGSSSYAISAAAAVNADSNLLAGSGGKSGGGKSSSGGKSGGGGGVLGKAFKWSLFVGAHSRC